MTTIAVITSIRMAQAPFMQSIPFAVCQSILTKRSITYSMMDKTIISAARIA
jgi:hypothetical protein